MIKCETGCKITIEAGDVELGEGGRLPSFGVELKCKEDYSCCSSNKGINKGIQDQAQQHHSDGLKPILIQLPSSIPLGIDIDMVVPIVSYIQPYSPLRNHVSVGDIILVVNGKNVMKLNHSELCSLLNGRPQGHCSDGGDASQSPRMTKLVFLPRKFMQQQHNNKLEMNESIGVEVSHNTDNCRDECVNDKVKSSPAAASTEPEPTTTPSTPPTLISSDDCHDGEELDSTDARTGTQPSPSDIQSAPQQYPQQDEEDTSCAKLISSTSFSSSLLSTPDEMITTKGNVIFQQTHQIKHSTSNSSPVTSFTRSSLTSSSSSSASSSNSSIASSGGSDVGSHTTRSTNKESMTSSRGSIPFLDYLERKVEKLNEKNKIKSVDPRSAYVGTGSHQRNSNSIAKAELSPLSCQSVEAAETKNIRRLRREVLGVHLTVDVLKKNSRERMLVKSKLDVAREEQNAVLEDQQFVRGISAGSSFALSTESSLPEERDEKSIIVKLPHPRIGPETKKCDRISNSSFPLQNAEVNDNSLSEDTRSNKLEHDVIDLTAVSVEHQQKGTNSSGFVVDDDPATVEENECAEVDEDDIDGCVGVEKSERTDKNEAVAEQGIEENGNESMGEHQQPEAFQDDDLDDRDRRRHERMNREQPHIEYVNISNETEPETDISTLYGGVWIKELNFTAHRLEDSIMNRTEEGERNNKVWDLNSQQLQPLDHGIKTISSAAQKKRNWIIEMILLTLIVLGIIGIITIVAVFIKRD